jgi:hypothetical protein
MAERMSEVIGGGPTFRLRVVSRTGSRHLYLEVDRKTEGGRWATKRESLGHGDLPEARRHARAVLAAMLVQPAATPAVVGALTLGQVVARFVQSEQFARCAPGTQQDYQGAFAILLDFVDPATGTPWRQLPAAHLDPEKVQALVNAWTGGTYRHPRMTRTRAKPNRVRNALAALRTACNWAHAVRTDRGRLLPEKVFDGILLPAEKNPVQPRMDDATLEQLLALAETFPTRGDGRFLFRLLLEAAEAFGNRINALLHLRPADLRADEVWWDPAFDKMGQGRTSYLDPALKAKFDAELARPGRPASPWVFYALSGSTVRTRSWASSGHRGWGIIRCGGNGAPTATACRSRPSWRRAAGSRSRRRCATRSRTRPSGRRSPWLAGNRVLPLRRGTDGRRPLDGVSYHISYHVAGRNIAVRRKSW